LLAALLVTDVERVRAGGLEPSSIKAAFPISGTLSRDGMSGQMGYEVPAGPLMVEPRSPIALSHQASAPVFLTWGGAERQLERVERSTLQFMNAVRDAGQPVDWLFEPGADHFMTHLNTGNPDSPWVATVRRWFETRPSRLTGDRP
jgi:acetyl esterase/lipase